MNMNEVKTVNRREYKHLARRDYTGAQYYQLEHYVRLAGYAEKLIGIVRRNNYGWCFDNAFRHWKGE